MTNAGTCRNCAQPITHHPQFVYLPDSKGWSHDQTPNSGSYFCDPDLVVTTDWTGRNEPHAEPE